MLLKGAVISTDRYYLISETEFVKSYTPERHKTGLNCDREQQQKRRHSN